VLSPLQMKRGTIVSNDTMYRLYTYSLGHRPPPDLHLGLLGRSCHTGCLRLYPGYNADNAAASPGCKC
jgi:hypothetical protein